ncbi:MAG: NAD(P)/FAD-dependent oxidoreductase [Rhodospirillales bacterium]
MSNTSHSTEVAIIGAGPAGLFAVFQCGMLNMGCHVIDALEMVGGQCTALYPEKPIYDIPGYPEITAGDLIAKLEKQAAAFEPVYHLNQQVVELSEAADMGWRLATSSGVEIAAQAVIIAAGVGAFGPKRPPLEGIERFEGKCVHYLVKRRQEYRNKKVVIAGGGDSAVDWALSLSDVAGSVAIVHRRDKFRAAPGSAEKLKKRAEDGAIELVTPFQLAGLEGDGDRLTAVIVSDLDGNQKRLEADVLLPFFGLSQNLGPIAEWGLNLDHNHISVDQATGATNRQGIFAIGDIATYRGKLKLILCGFSEAALAAQAAHSLIHPEEELHFEYSTTRGAPGKG